MNNNLEYKINCFIKILIIFYTFIIFPCEATVTPIVNNLYIPKHLISKICAICSGVSGLVKWQTSSEYRFRCLLNLLCTITDLTGLIIVRKFKFNGS